MGEIKRDTGTAVCSHGSPRHCAASTERAWCCSGQSQPSQKWMNLSGGGRSRPTPSRPPASSQRPPLMWPCRRVRYRVTTRSHTDKWDAESPRGDCTSPEDMSIFHMNILFDALQSVYYSKISCINIYIGYYWCLCQRALGYRFTQDRPWGYPDGLHILTGIALPTPHSLGCEHFMFWK